MEGLGIKAGGLYVDGTVGYGGHASEIAKRLGSGRLIAIDRDAEALEKARERLSEHECCITYVHGNFGDLAKILDENRAPAVDGLLFDLGVSSPQLDNGKRGFSYMQDAPLDMRMDRRDGMTAFSAVNNWTEDRLRKVFYEYGEEKYAGLIARAIVKRRATEPISTTLELSNIILSALPSAARRKTHHPSKRCFQALRIAVNDELAAIASMLEAAPGKLKADGRLCVISFHSLEDRIVKNSFAVRASGCVCPRDFPVCVCGNAPTLKLITKKPIVPGELEAMRNPRARSAKLRIAQRL